MGAGPEEHSLAGGQQRVHCHPLGPTHDTWILSPRCVLGCFDFVSLLLCPLRLKTIKIIAYGSIYCETPILLLTILLILNTRQGFLAVLSILRGTYVHIGGF